MCAAQVVDVDVVAEAGAVPRGIIGAEHLQRRVASECGADRQRDQVCLWRVILAQASIVRRTRGVEIAEAREPKTV